MTVGGVPLGASARPGVVVAERAHGAPRHAAHTCCDDCGLRFSNADAAHLRVCPMCCGPLAPASPAQTLGHQLYVDMTAHLPDTGLL